MKMLTEGPILHQYAEITLIMETIVYVNILNVNVPNVFYKSGYFICRPK